MNCDECKNLITVSVYGTLSPGEKTRLKAHLRDCPKCAEIYERSGKLNHTFNEKDDIPLPDKEKSWQIISAKALGRKGRWFKHLMLPKPIYQFALVLLLLIVGFAAGYFFRSEGLKGSQLAQLQEEISQIREITAASLLRQESLNSRLREIGLSMPLTRSDERPLGFMLRSLIGGTEEVSIPSREEQTSPLVDIALTLVRQINQSDKF